MIIFICLSLVGQHIIGGTELCKAMKTISVKNDNLINILSLRKYVAVVAQLLNLREKELDMLSNHFGHDIKGFENSSVEMKKICKLFLTLDQGKAYKVKGKSLNEIDIEDIIVQGNTTQIKNANNKETSIENIQDSSIKQKKNLQKKNIIDIKSLDLENLAEVNISNNRENSHELITENIEEPNSRMNEQIDMDDIVLENIPEINNAVEFTMENDEDKVKDNICEQNIYDKNNVTNSEIDFENIGKEYSTKTNNGDNCQTRWIVKDSDLTQEKIFVHKDKNSEINSKIDFTRKTISTEFFSINTKEYLVVENCKDISRREFEQNEIVQKSLIFREIEMNNSKNNEHVAAENLQDTIERAFNQTENVQENNISNENCIGETLCTKNYSEINKREELRVDFPSRSTEQEFQQNSNVENTNNIINEISIDDLDGENFSEIYRKDNEEKLSFNIVQGSPNRNAFKQDEVVEKNRKPSTDFNTENRDKEYYPTINNTDIKELIAVRDSINTSNEKVIEQNIIVQKNNEISKKNIGENFIDKEICTEGTIKIAVEHSQTTLMDKVFKQKEIDQKSNDSTINNAPTQNVQFLVRKKWDKRIKSAAFEFFGFNLTNKIPPRQKECLEFLEKYQVENRTWKDVKRLIYNTYRISRD